MLEVLLPDGTARKYESAVTVGEIATSIGPGLARAAVAGEVDGTVMGLDFQLPAQGQVVLKILTKNDPRALNVMRHSCAHIMARAVMRRFKGVQLAFGPTIESGFYYDFEVEHALTEEDFPAIEEEMQRIIALDEPFERIEEPRERALQICADLGQEFKVDVITARKDLFRSKSCQAAVMVLEVIPIKVSFAPAPGMGHICEASRIIRLVLLRLELTFTERVVIAHSWATVTARHIQFVHKIQIPVGDHR